MNIEKQKRFELIDELFSEDLSSELTSKEEEAVSSALKKFRRLKVQTKAELNRAKFQRVNDFMNEIKQGLENKIEKYVELSNRVFENPKYQELAPMFSNLTEVSEDDQKSILLDAKYLELFDELEDDFEKLD